MNIQELQSQSTLRLLLLTVGTYVVYPVYFLRRLTNLANVDLTPDRRISHGFVVVNFVFAYLSLAMFVPYLVVPDGHPVGAISNLTDIVAGVLMLVWCFVPFR